MLREDRILKLQELARDKNIDYVFIVPGANLYYFTGLSMGLSERPAMAIVPSQGEPLFYCPAFEAEKVRQVTGISRFITYSDEEGPYQAMAEWLEKQKCSRVRAAYEYRAARLLEYMVVRSAVSSVELHDARPLMAQLRMQKDSEELKSMQRAAEIADAMMQAVRQALVPQATEAQVREAAVRAVKEIEPKAEPAFVSVASGPRGALPHAGQADRVINSGELVVVDLGARYQGYCSDITRTLPVGQISDRLRDVYELVVRANEAGRQFVRPGVTCEEIDRETRRVIEDGGYGEYFTHRTGHGLGLEVHEEPYIVKGNLLKVKEGMTFTIEPGIYLPGEAGIRIEDDVVVTESGCRSLTSFPRYLVY